jgi:fermentation-respiration switch protein FrsA (DUF1100 family)
MLRCVTVWLALCAAALAADSPPKLIPGIVKPANLAKLAAAQNKRAEPVVLPPVLYLQGTADLMHPVAHLERFVQAYAAVKESEYDAYLQVISAWEREHLLLNV